MFHPGRLLLLLSALALPCASLLAQDVTGTWQGTIHLPNGRDAREVIKIAKDVNALKATLYSIDLAPGQTFPSSAVTVQSAAVTILFPGIGANYKATLAVDGKSMAGTFTQGQPLGLDLTRATEQTAWEIPPPAARPKAMPADADPTFAVATIKPSKPDARGIGIGVQPGGRLSTLNESLIGLISFAYGVQAKQVTGAPAWADTDKYDIVAQPDVAGIPNDKQIRGMMQKLLADRFKLTFHRDRKELSVYAITVGKLTPKLTPSTGDPNGLPGLGLRGLGSVAVRNGKISDFAQLLQSVILDRPVVDQTGLPGRFDFALDWRPDEFQFQGLGNGPRPPASPDDSRPDLFTAFQQQLGLKLESTKAEVGILVMDHVEHPSEN